jgi:antitoxin (DNA-binding transcriptional repressor) of toxin-antitoxin stability system
MPLYQVTAKGGPVVDIAGVRRRPGDQVTLTAEQAEWELKRGLIEPVPAATPDASPVQSPPNRRRR